MRIMLIAFFVIIVTSAVITTAQSVIVPAERKKAAAIGYIEFTKKNEMFVYDKLYNHNDAKDCRYSSMAGSFTDTSSINLANVPENEAGVIRKNLRRFLNGKKVMVYMEYFYHDDSKISEAKDIFCDRIEIFLLDEE